MITPVDVSVLKEAVASGNIPIAANFMNQTNTSINHIVDPDDGSSLLHIAVHNEQTAMAAYLIERGADVNITDSDLQTPLHIACFVANVELVSLLIENGADVQAEDSDNRIPADLIDDGDTSVEAKEACSEILEEHGWIFSP